VVVRLVGVRIHLPGERCKACGGPLADEDLDRPAAPWFCEACVLAAMMRAFTVRLRRYHADHAKEWPDPNIN
jgi:hypothetical protein